MINKKLSEKIKTQKDTSNDKLKNFKWGSFTHIKSKDITTQPRNNREKECMENQDPATNPLYLTSEFLFVETNLTKGVSYFEQWIAEYQKVAGPKLNKIFQMFRKKIMRFFKSDIEVS